MVLRLPFVAQAAHAGVSSQLIRIALLDVVGNADSATRASSGESANSRSQLYRHGRAVASAPRSSRGGPRHRAVEQLHALRPPPDERGGNRYVRPTATAPHSD